MSRKSKISHASTQPTGHRDAERKAAIENLRAMRAQGAKNLAMGAKITDFREYIDTPAMGCGIATYILRTLQNQKMRDAILAEGEQIFAKISGAPRRSSGETILYLDPNRAGPLAMALALASAGLKAAGKRAGWATYRGMVEARALHQILADLGLVEVDYRLDELPAFIPQGAEADTGLSKPGPAGMRSTEAMQAQTVPDPEIDSMADIPEPGATEQPVMSDPEPDEREPLSTPVAGAGGPDPVERFDAPGAAANRTTSEDKGFEPETLADAAAEMSRLLYRNAIPVTSAPTVLLTRESQDVLPGRYNVEVFTTTDLEPTTVD